MISSLRLLAGLTTLMSALCLLHFSVMGPCGTWDSIFVISCFFIIQRFVKLHQALYVQDDYNQHETADDKRRKDVRNAFEPFHPHLAVPAHGLHHAPHAVRQVEPERHEPYDIGDDVADMREDVPYYIRALL